MIVYTKEERRQHRIKKRKEARKSERAQGSLDRMMRSNGDKSRSVRLIG